MLSQQTLLPQLLHENMSSFFNVLSVKPRTIDTENESNVIGIYIEFNEHSITIIKIHFNSKAMPLNVTKINQSGSRRNNCIILIY